MRDILSDVNLNLGNLNNILSQPFNLAAVIRPRDQAANYHQELELNDDESYDDETDADDEEEYE